MIKAHYSVGLHEHVVAEYHVEMRDTSMLVHALRV